MSLKPIVLDLETSGVSLEKSGIWQIGAIDLNTMEEFLDEARIDDDDLIVNFPEARKTVEEVTGKTEAEMRDPEKQSQKELLEKFFKWIEGKKFKNFVCQHPQFDLGWILLRAEKYGLEKPFGNKAFDLHTIAQIKFYEIHGKLSITDAKGKSDMNLGNILKFCGFPEDPRGAHNALEDSKLTAECFSRLMYGKNLFSEYAKFEIPEALKK